MVPKIPDALLSILRLPPQHSLTLITNSLGATSNWILLRYLLSILNEPSDQTPVGAVIFVSWLKPPGFWIAEAKRVLGLDLRKKEEIKRLIFIDAISSLFLTSSNDSESSPAAHVTLRSPALKEFSKAVVTALDSLKSRSLSLPQKITLILDAPSIMLHTSTPAITGSDLVCTLLELRSQVDAVIVAMPADEGLLSTHTVHSSTPLERENSSTLITLAHQADMLIGCRVLETGWANDVTGIVRFTKGGAGLEYDDETKETTAGQTILEGEWLYHVSGDGGVNVWARGSVR